MFKIAPGSPQTYSQLRAEKAKKISNAHMENSKPETLPPSDTRLNHEEPEVQHVLSSNVDNNKHTVHKNRKRSIDELSLMISVKRSKLAPVQRETERLKLMKKKKRPHSPKSYKISISRELLNHNRKLPSPMPQPTPKTLENNVVPANYVNDEPVKKVKKHKEKKHKKLLLPVQGLYVLLLSLCIN